LIKSTPTDDPTADGSISGSFREELCMFGQPTLSELLVKYKSNYLKFAN
jgi:hypothetical protein